ncbi:MAG: SDR family NAD(P)-dependent oxidoreductase, partial [Actinomycetota bacterium]
MGSMDGRTAIVTGAASGLGLGIARSLVQRGARVALIDIDEAAVRAAAASIGDRAVAFTADVADRASVDRAVTAAAEQ